MTRIIPAALLFVCAMAVPAARAQDDVAALVQALEMPAILDVMHEEGLGYGEELAAEMFGDAGNAEWQGDVEAIYETGRLGEMFETQFTKELEGADLGPMIDFFTSDLGRRVTTLEVSARRAMLNQEVDDAARLALEEALAADDPRIDLVKDFIDAGDLIEANVAGGLNANLAFYRGLVEGGALPYGLSEEEILADVWGQEGAIREDTEDWLLSYLFLAYQPLADEDLKAYTEFSRTEAGVVLNRALFGAFDAMFSDVSFRLGKAAARQMSGQEL
ncbi:hypothetical protein [Ostreiculturibacter nitratireducens]|uniref:hypothetical protein n=1 Tax=Ostreiculturibacter nitratireducens TaxID=3075226 RepID=UPI0031B5D8B1